MPNRSGRDGGPAPTESVSDDLIDGVLAASRALVALSARSIAASPGVTLPQFRMLVVLDNGPLNLSGLADALDVAPSTALRMVDRLVEAGMVERRAEPADRRQIRLSLSPAGRRTVRKVTNRRRRDLAAVLARLDPERREAVVRSLADFAEAAEPITGTATGG